MAAVVLMAAADSTLEPSRRRYVQFMLDDDAPRTIGQKPWVRVVVWLIVAAMLLPIIAIFITQLF